jgi:hypothetical protein
VKERTSIESPKPTKPHELPHRIGGPINEYNRRLMAALAPKPIEGVDNWGIPDETDAPCDPDREVKTRSFSK